MAKRVRSTDPDAEQANYFADEKDDLEFATSGCRILDCTLAGGWPLGRISNVVGDRSTGKSLLAIEGCANFAYQYPKGRIFYREVESAFDKKYGAALGLPVDRVDFGKKQLETVEDLFADLKACCEICTKRNVPGLYIVDSFDALSTEIDMAREFGEQAYPDKPKMMSELFRKQVRRIADARMHFMVISQVRDKIGVMFGKKYSRSGGRALDFYASQVLYLSHMQTLVKTVGGTKRATGVRIKAKCEKNKIGLPFRDCEFIIRFGYGIEDLTASVEWLEQVKHLKDFTKQKADDILDDMDRVADNEYADAAKMWGDNAEKVWREIDKELLPKRHKYNGAGNDQRASSSR